MDFHLLNKLIEHDIGQLCDVLIFLDQRDETIDVRLFRSSHFIRLLQFRDTALKLQLLFVILSD